MLGNSVRVRCVCHHNNCNYCEGHQPVRRTVSATCLYAIVRNGTAKPASLDEILRRERRQEKKISAEHEQDWLLTG